jgi:hypothetical protein
MSTVKHVLLTADAREEISAEMPYGEGDAEAGGVLYGRVDSGRIVVDRFDPVPLGEPGRVTINIADFTGRELWATSRSPGESRLIGDIHTHQEIELPRACPSDTDLRGWASFASATKGPWVGAILHPRRQLWRAGFPEADWVAPLLDAWVVDRPGAEPRPVMIVDEPGWLRDLAKTVQFHDPDKEEAA